MRELDLKTKLLGHPLSMVGMGGITAASLIVVSQDLSGWFFAIPALVGMGAVLTANEARAKYKAWRAAWDVMAGTQKPPINWRIVGGVLGVLGFIVLFAGTAGETSANIFIGLALIAAIVAAIGSFTGLGRNRQRAQRPMKDADPVTICGSSVKAPPLKDAYSELPDHARETLGR